MKSKKIPQKQIHASDQGLAMGYLQLREKGKRGNRLYRF